MQPGQQYQQQYQQPGTDIVPQDVYTGSVTGLEDFEASDLRLPRLSINHDEGGFTDSLNPENVMPELHIIALGLIKQRIMWPALMVDDGNDSNPMCKSTDHNIGFPNVTSTDQRELFPWNAAQWNPNDFPRDEFNRITLPCDSCRLKEWGSHPDGKKTWCGEQHGIPVLYSQVDPESTTQPEPSMIALFTAQRSSINASKAFFAGMVRQQQPAFAFRAVWKLRKEQRGKNTYYTPLMTIVGKTDQAQWSTYAASYTEVRDFVTAPPRIRDDQQQAGVNGQGIAAQNQMSGFQNQTWTPGQQAPVQPQYQQPVQQQPVQHVQPVVDPAYLEWQRQQAAAAAQAAAAQAQPTPVAQPVAQPVQAAAPVTEMPTPFAATPAPSSATPGRDDDDPLPF